MRGGARRPRIALPALCVLWLALAAPLLPAADPAVDPSSVPPPVLAAFETITEAELRADLVFLASSTLEGRDSPSPGLTRAAEYVAARLAQAGYAGAGPQGEFILPFTRRLPAPDPAGCRLELVSPEDAAADETTRLLLGSDFVPVPHARGEGEGRAVLIGFGIQDAGERYNDVPGDLSGKIAVIVSGEPRHRIKFKGPQVTAAADLYGKLERLARSRAAGVLVVRRPPAPDEDKVPRGRDELPEEPPFGFRHTWATWANEAMPLPRETSLPALELTPDAARRLLGVDPIAFVEEVEKKGQAPRPHDTGRVLRLASATHMAEVSIPNVAGVLRGSDPALADEYVVLGAHLDHVGVDTRGRIGFGADDNASGVAALLEVATALAVAQPRRSILACAFGAEEDGLIGSRAFVERPPVPKDAFAVMINLDMVGRGDVKEVAVIGVQENPGFEKRLEQARKLLPSKVSKIVVRQGQHLFQRSDHFPFHLAGVPVLFFFEGLPETRNADYHTWRDTFDLVDVNKVARTARLVFATAWLLAQDDERPPRPK